MTKDEYRDLLQQALPVAVDAGTIAPNPHTLFTPPTHRAALDPDATIVRGARGVGKTVWFRALQDPELRELAAQTYQIGRLRAVVPLAGYGSELQPDRYPGPPVLADLLRSGADPQDIWTAVLLTALEVPQLVGSEVKWAERVNWVRTNPEDREQVLAAADAEAGAQRVIKLLLFDALDALHPDRADTDRLVDGILRLALELRTRTRHLRAKAFIRHDMLDEAMLRFPDASKLRSNAADLTWTAQNLFGLLFHYLGNADDSAAESFRSATGAWPELAGRFVPPGGLVGDSGEQQAAFELIAGPYMGTDRRKGRPYTWLPNHLIDGIGQVSPRSFLSALKRANEISRDKYAAHSYALHWDGIRQGVQQASSIRVDEISEDLPWVRICVSPLAGLQVPIPQAEVVQRWRESGLSERLATSADSSSVRVGPRSMSNLDSLVDELIELGVLTRRADGRLDLPDVYRVAFGVGRKGGVPRLRG